MSPNLSTYATLKKVKIPPPIRPPQRRRRWPWEELSIGEMFFIPNRTKNNMTTQASTEGKKLGRKFSTRMIYMRKTPIGWRPSWRTERGAVLGIGIWRIK